jgi:hypothetical protein
VLLRKRGMIDPAQERLTAQKMTPIEEHLVAFERSLGNATGKHQKLTMTRVRRVVEGCGLKSIGKIDREEVESFLIDLRAEVLLGARTYNHYLQAMDALCKWLVATRGLAANPLVGLERLNAENGRPPPAAGALARGVGPARRLGPFERRAGAGVPRRGAGAGLPVLIHHRAPPPRDGEPHAVELRA